MCKNLTEVMKTTEGPFSTTSGFFDSGKGKDVEVALEIGLKAVRNYLEDQERKLPCGAETFRFEDGYLSRTYE
jgi:hypothetical protein